MDVEIDMKKIIAILFALAMILSPFAYVLM